jgi:NAD(P)-dependent dehydrogenase (short-subunit alcohol dehydrogenase family)
MSDTASSSSGVALVTGANKGLGREIARQIAGRGFHVVLTARDARRGRESTDALAATGAPVSFIVMDVSDRASVLAASNEFAQRFERLDVLVNNAGILDDDGMDVLDVPADVFERTLRTNTIGPLLVAQAFWIFLARAMGRVINVSSGAGALGEMGGGYPAYGPSKSALNAITRKLAVAGRSHEVVVNCMCPGWVRTDMGGPNAGRSVGEGADTAVWLATDAPRSITGKFLRDRREIEW